MAKPAKAVNRLRILHLADRPHAAKLLREVLDMYAIDSIRSSTSPDDAYQMVQCFPFDIGFIEWGGQPHEAVELIRRIRRSPDSPNPFLPLIMAVDRADPALLSDARDAGVHELVARPMTRKSLSAKLSAIFDDPRPFVRSNDYFGPCRRRKRMPFEGEDRRAEVLEV